MRKRMQVLFKKTQIVRYILYRTHLSFAKWLGQPRLGV